VEHVKLDEASKLSRHYLSWMDTLDLSCSTEICSSIASMTHSLQIYLSPLFHSCSVSILFAFQMLVLPLTVFFSLTGI
jgi:hypothetical protein